MKKVLATATKYIFGVFCIAILGLLMSLTFQALKRIFPDNPANQIWGLVLFDIAAMCWALAFVFYSKSASQYAVSSIGFLTGFLGTLGMVAAEVMLGQTLTQVNQQQIGAYITYGFIIVTAVHAALIYAHHATGPEIVEEIEIGIAVGEVNTETIRVTTDMVKKNMANMSGYQAQEKFAALQRSLHLPVVVTPGIGFAEFDPSQPAQPPYPLTTEQPKPKDNRTWLERLTGRGKPSPAAKKRQTIVDVPKLKNPLPGPADFELAASIMPGIAPYRDCPNCHDTVPLTFKHCAACGQEMSDVAKWKEQPQPRSQEEPKADDAPFRQPLE